MRVLLVVRPMSGGMKEHVLALARGLVARGHEAELAAPEASEITGAARAAGLIVHDIPLAGPLNPVQDPLAVRSLSRLIYRGGFDLVHAHGFKAGFIGRLAIRTSGGAGYPFVITAHNHVLTRAETPAAARWHYRTVERSLERYVSAYIAISESIARELLDAYNLPADKVIVVRNGIDVEPFLAEQDRAAARASLGVAPDAPVVGLAARFSAQKGLRDLLTATPELVRRIPGVRVVIGGSGPLESQLRSQAMALGVSDAVVWPGHVLNMPRFLSALDVFVSPATTEAFGIALMEAAAAGVPTIATRVGAVPEVILDGETGLLVAPHDPTALAQAIVGLLDDRHTAIKLAEHARRRAITEFSPDAMVESTLGVYATVLGEARGAGANG